MSKQAGCTPLVPLEGFHTLIALCASACRMAIPTPHIISIIWLSRLWLSSLMWAFHTFLSSSSTIFLFRRLGVNFLAHAHPLHECSKYRKGVDQFDLYLASGLGTSPDKNPKETKCETLVDSCSQQPFFSFFPVPCLHANTIWRHSSHGQQELLYLLFFYCLC